MSSEYARDWAGQYKDVEQCIRHTTDLQAALALDFLVQGICYTLVKLSQDLHRQYWIDVPGLDELVQRVRQLHPDAAKDAIRAESA